MRVVGGIYRSRRLSAPKDRLVRPTADMVKEALMNMLSARLRGARVLELFCGTGQLGIEALSRGAESCVFVDNSRTSCDLTRGNLDSLKIQAEVLLADWSAALAGLSAKGEKFDIILADPPYSSGVYGDLQQRVLERALLKTGGMLALEYDKLQPVCASQGFIVEKQRGYGRRCLLLLRPE